jgi:hypothetical protein
MTNYPTIEFPNDTVHMLFDIGYTYGILVRTRRVLELALADIRDEQIEAEIQAVLKAIEVFQKGRLQTVDALYANADSAIEVLNRIVAAQK